MADVIRIDIEARDYATSTFRSVTSAVGSFASNANNAVSRFNSSLRGYNNAMRGFNTAVRNTLVYAGREIYNFTTDAIKAFADLELQHSKTMGAMQADYAKTAEGQAAFLSDAEKLKQQAITLGTTGPTGKGSLTSVTDVSLAQTALVKSGVSPEQLLNTNALQAVMKFAGGNDMKLETAAEFGIQLTTMFGKSLDEWETMFDQVTYAADVSPVDVEDIMASLTRGGGLPGSIGVPLEEVLGALSVMGYSGLKGGSAGTALQAFYSRGINPTGVTSAGPAPTAKVEELYNDVSSFVVDEQGNYTGMETFLEGLNEYTADLSDQEYSWFAKKLFGMFQQKAMYALGKTDENGDLLYTDVVSGITDKSGGTIDSKWDIMLESDYGDLEKVKNAWAGFKTDVGDRLLPAISEFSDQLFGALTTGNFEFNFEGLRQAIYDSGDLIAEKYGDQIGDLVKNLGDFILDAVEIGGAVAPTVGGIGNGILRLFAGDFDGAIEAFAQGIEDTNTNIDGLPEDLQEMAKGARNVIIALAALTGVNGIAKLMEGVSTIYKYTIGKAVSAITKVTSANTSVTSANSVVNATSVIVNAGTTTITTGATTATVATMTASTPLMNVTATVVNVFGGSGLGNGGGSGLGGGGTPLLPSGGGLPALGGGGLPALGSGSSLVPYLAAGGGGALLGSGGQMLQQALLPAGSNAAAQALLPGAGAAAANYGDDVINMVFNKATGTWMTEAAAGKAAGAAALKVGLKALGFIGTFIAVADMLTISAGINNSPASMVEAYNEAYASGARGIDEINEHMINNDKYPGMLEGGEMPNGEWFYPAQMAEFLQNSSAFINSGEGMQMFYDAITNQLGSGGKIDEKFLSNFMTENGIDHGYGQQMLESLLNNMFNATYTTPGHYAGDYANKSVDEFIKANYNNTQDWSNNGTIAQLLAVMNGLLDNMTYVEGSDNVYADATGVFYQLLQDGTLQEVSANISQASISLADAIKMAGLNPMELGMGPLSDEGFLNAVTSMLNNPTAQQANSDMLAQIAGAIREVEIANQVTVDIPKPSVNVNVNVRVDPQGNVTQSVIPSYSGFDTYLYQQSQRYGSTQR